MQYIKDFSHPARCASLVLLLCEQAALGSHRAGQHRISRESDDGWWFISSLVYSSGASLAYLVDTLVLLGLGVAFFSSPNTNAIMSSMEKCSF